jgi:hypothetical protein
MKIWYTIEGSNVRHCLHCDDTEYKKWGGVKQKPIIIPEKYSELVYMLMPKEHKPGQLSKYSPNFLIEINKIFMDAIGFLPIIEDDYYDRDRYYIVNKLLLPEGFTGKPRYNTVIWHGEELPDILFKYMNVYVNAIRDTGDEATIKKIMEMCDSCVLFKYLLTVLVKIKSYLLSNKVSAWVSYHEYQALEFTGLSKYTRDHIFTKTGIFDEKYERIKDAVFETGIPTWYIHILQLNVYVRYSIPVDTLEYVNIDQIKQDVKQIYHEQYVGQLNDVFKIIVYHQKIAKKFKKLQDTQGNEAIIEQLKAQLTEWIV